MSRKEKRRPNEWDSEFEIPLKKPHKKGNFGSNRTQKGNQRQKFLQDIDDLDFE